MTNAKLPPNPEGYVAATDVVREDGTVETVYLAEIIAARMGIVGEFEFVDGNPLNCRRENIRAKKTS
jgi:hypothetical protein